jgi:hypothetical protein
MNSDFLLLEDNRRRDVIRTIVRDIITTYKVEDDGEFYLPNFIDDDKDFYEFPGMEELVIELVISVNNEIEDFVADANFYRKDGIIQVIIEYNPENKETLIYDLIGELNEVVAHEIRHVDQKGKGMFDLDVPKEEDPYKYYTQPHELDAQRFGFKRLAKLTKTPLDVVVKRWFKTHKQVHNLNQQEEQDVISKILNQN